MYGINHLAAEPNQVGRWDGIRNYQARNFLRDQVRKGDIVFLYHSSCKEIGIVGIAKIVKAAYPDPTQFDPTSPYFDAKSTHDKPRWISVDIQLDERFTHRISLATIKSHPELQNMVLVKQGRLSIQPVTQQEADIIKTLHD